MSPPPDLVRSALDFDAAEAASERGEALILALDGFEGPLHLLLALARGQKVDLLQISVARLAEQYLAFVESQRRRRFTLAADYLVMAAWLTYLKSRLVLPKPRQDESPSEPPAEDLAEALAFRLAKLDAMRRAGEALGRRPQLGRDVFGRGDPEAKTAWPARSPKGDLYALVCAYAERRACATRLRYAPPARVQAYPLEAARLRLQALALGLADWTPLAALAPAPSKADDGAAGPPRASYVASTFSAGLEMVRDGVMEARQLQAFADLYLRARRGAETAPRGRAA